MKKIYLSDVGPKVSEAIYGFYRWNDVNASGLALMERITNLCIELGINAFDHADIYGDYECESLFGQVMAQHSFKREDVVLFTKCGYCIPNANRPDVRLAHYNCAADYVKKSVETSLRNFKTDYIDVFLLNGLDSLANLEETALAIEALKNAGKIKHFGVTGFSVFQHQLLASYLRVPIVTNHVELNLLNTNALDNGQIDYIKQRYMRPLAASPLAAGRIENGTDAQAVRVRTKLIEMSEKYDANIESLAVAWLVKLGALPLIGTQSEVRIKNIANAFSIDMDKQDWYELYFAAKE